MSAINKTIQCILWAKGYREEQIEDLYKCMKECKLLTTTQYNVMIMNFRDYMILGGMLTIVVKYIEIKTLVFNNKKTA